MLALHNLPQHLARLLLVAGSEAAETADRQRDFIGGQCRRLLEQPQYLGSPSWLPRHHGIHLTDSRPKFAGRESLAGADWLASRVNRSLPPGYRHFLGFHQSLRNTGAAAGSSWWLLDGDPAIGWQAIRDL